MAKNKSSLILVTDPQKVKEILDHEQAHEKALEDTGRIKREARLLAKLAAKAAAGGKMKYQWSKIDGSDQTGSLLLTGHIMRSHDKDSEHFTLSAAVDYAKLYALNPAQQDVSAHQIEFNQHRAASITLGTYNTKLAAQTALQRMDQYLMHVLAEAGAESTVLALTNNQLRLANNDNAAAQTYSEALRTARLVEHFRRTIIDSKRPDFTVLTRIIADTIAAATALDYTREEENKDRIDSIKMIFDRNIGSFVFTRRNNMPGATMRHETRLSGGGKGMKTRFEGDLTASSFQDNFINWLAAAAKERGILDDAGYNTLHDEISAIQGIPLRESKLGMFSPFAAQSGFKPN